MHKYFREKHKFCEFRDTETAKNINNTLNHMALSPRSFTLTQFYIEGSFYGPDRLKTQLMLLVGWS